jgi:AraC-like DNA-binding protein
MSAPNEPQETTVSIRWMIPFIRVTGTSPGDLKILAREGITLRDFVDPDTRIRHRAIMELLAMAVQRLGDPEIGLRAGERVEPGDYDALEYAARSCANLRDAILCAVRYQHLMHGGQEARLIEHGDLATWQWTITDGVEQLPAANDFALVSSRTLGRLYTGGKSALREVHFLHATPTSEEAYRRLFSDAVLKFDMGHNALVFDRAHLDSPMSHAHAGLQAAYEQHVSGLLLRLKRDEGVAGRVRNVLVDQLRAGDFSVNTVARRLAMSVTTLRRRLGEEDTSHRAILDEVRRELAQSYLGDASLAISEVAFLLGFSHVTGLYKAFHRWSEGTTPAEYRAQLKRR